MKAPLTSHLPRRSLLAAGLGLAATTLARPALADSFPSKPLHIVVPFTPGGSSDLLGRAVGQELGQGWAPSVVIDNVPGAGGSIGAERVAKAPADGYTLLMGHIGTLAVNPWLYPKLGYDPVKSFAPVAWVARVPNVLVVNADVPARTLAELVAYAKANPGKLAYGSGGNGSAAQLAMEYFKLQTGTAILHIPYRGTAPSITDLLAGQVQMLFTGAPALLPHIKSGKIRALAVSSPQRLPQLPEVPTVAESGVAGTRDFSADQWYGIVAPAGTPPAVVAALNARINQALNAPEVRKRLELEGAQATPATPQAFAELIASELPRWGRVVKAARISVD